MGNIIKLERKSPLTEIEKADLRTKIIGNLLSTKRPGIDNLIAYMESNGYFEAPASSKYHSNFEGGLAYHSDMVLTNLLDMQKNRYLGVEQDELIIAAYCHDLCKMNFYEEGYRLDKNAEGKWVAKTTYTINEKQVFGHSEKSALLASKFIELTDNEIYMILYHMGRADVKESKQFDKAIEKCPAILLMCHADEEAALLDEYVYENTKEYPASVYNEYMKSKSKNQ